MVPARNLLRRHYDTYGSAFFADIQMELYRDKRDIAMAEDTSRCGGGGDGEEELEATGEEEEEGEVGISGGPAAKEIAEQDIQQRYYEGSTSSNWLNLSIGGGSSSSSAAVPAPPPPGDGRGRRNPAELELFPGGRNQLPPAAIHPMTPAVATMRPLFTTQTPQATWHHRGGEMQLGFWGGAGMMAHPPQAAALMFNYMYPMRSYPVATAGMGIGGESSSSWRGAAAAADLRVTNPPPRHHAGLWFVLRAAENQARELLLPQIPKSYLRIKDGRMTVRLLMKYLVNKLGLENESEVEITCRGRQLEPNLTLQHVRDRIWSPTEALTMFIPDLPASDHVMTLHYSRSS